MIVRHILFAGLFAAASFATAGTVDGSTATVQAAFTSSTNFTSSEPTAFQSTLAGPGGMWSSQSRLGDIGSSSIMLFSQTDYGSAQPANFTDTAKVSTDASLTAPSAADMPASVIAADVTVNAAAPNALAADVPEPATGMLMLAGLLGAGFISRRRK